MVHLLALPEFSANAKPKPGYFVVGARLGCPSTHCARRRFLWRATEGPKGKFKSSVTTTVRSGDFSASIQYRTAAAQVHERRRFQEHEVRPLKRHGGHLAQPGGLERSVRRWAMVSTTSNPMLCRVPSYSEPGLPSPTMRYFMLRVPFSAFSRFSAFSLQHLLRLQAQIRQTWPHGCACKPPGRFR